MSKMEVGGGTGIRTRRKHPDKALNALAIRAIEKPGRYADGNGLYLKVDPSGAKRWELRTVVRGKRCDIGLGGLRTVTLAKAREQALKYRALARNDEDPLAEKRRAKRVVPTFRVAAETVHKEHAKAWKNPKHGDQWINTLKTHAYPIFGDRRVDQIDTPEILKALLPIWLTKQKQRGGFGNASAPCWIGPRPQASAPAAIRSLKSARRCPGSRSARGTTRHCRMSRCRRLFRRCAAATPPPSPIWLSNT
jgi:hypothetical protein